MTHGNRRKNGIKICQWNAGGGYLSSKQPELQNIVAEYTPHVLGITESAFKISQNMEDVTIPDYNLHFANTLANPGLEISRACVYVHKDIKAVVRNDLMNDSFSSVWLELGKPRQRRILVCVLYREWQYVNQPDDRSRSIPAQLERWCGFLDQWEAAISTGSEIIVTGDANLDFLKWRDENIATNSHTYRLRSLVTQLFDRIIPHGFVQLVSVATRVSQGQEPSGLDHFYCNYPEKLSEVEAHYRGGSDHKIIFGVRYTRSAISKPRIVRKRMYKNFKADEFIHAVQNISWWEVYTCENVEEAVKIMTRKISSILDKMAPIKNIQVRTKYAPWMSENTKQRLKERNEAQKIAVETNDGSDWARYKTMRNNVNTILRWERRTWQQKKLEDLGNDSSSVWKNVKNWIGWSKGGPPTKLIENGNLCSKPKDLARIMNEFFISKVKRLESELPPSNGDSLNLIKNIMRNHQCKFSLEAVHPDQILKIISNLKSSQSCGIDNIDSKVIKLIKHQITPVLTHVVNLSIRNQHFPSLWKKAKVIPLHKKSKTNLSKKLSPS